MICNRLTGFVLFLVVTLSSFINGINIDFFNQIIEISDNRMLIDRNHLFVSELDGSTIFQFKLQYDYNQYVNDIIVLDNSVEDENNEKINSILPYSYNSATNSIDIAIAGYESNSLDIDVIIQYSYKLLKTENQVIESLRDDIQSLYFPVKKVCLTNYHIDKFERTILNLTPEKNKTLRFSDGEESYIELKDNSEYILKAPLTDIPTTENDEGSTVNVYFDFSTPLLTVNKAIRNVYLSHWSNTIQFDEHYIIENEAPKLANNFKRKEYMVYQSNKYGGSGLALSQLEFSLPASSFNQYYKDDLGMITTMKTIAHPSANYDSLVLKPRYPILGSWKYIFNIGWFNKLSQFSHFLKYSETTGDQEFLLELPVLDGGNNLIYNDVTINIILPEGIKITSIYAPDMNSLPGDNKNPKIEFDKFANLFDYTTEKSTELKITYSNVNINSKLLQIKNSDTKIFVKYQINNFKVYYEKVLRLATWLFLALISIYLIGAINDNLKK